VGVFFLSTSILGAADCVVLMVQLNFMAGQVLVIIFKKKYNGDNDG